MNAASSIFLLLLATSHSPSPSTAITCYACSPCNAGNGSLELCPDQVEKRLNPKVATPDPNRFCIKGYVDDTALVARGCGHTMAQFYGIKMEVGCFNHTVMGKQATYCRCDEDNCNGGGETGARLHIVLMVLLYGGLAQGYILC